MIAITDLRYHKIFRERRRPRIAPGEEGEGSFGADLTFVVGTAATMINTKTPLDPAGSPISVSSELPAGIETKLRAGMTIGSFRLIRRLGRGAQGDVWKAKRLDPYPEIVALKILNPALAKQPHRLAQFRREAERGALLDGPSLLQVFEFGQAEDLLYMAMPYVEGTTLQEVIRGRRSHLRGEHVELRHRLIDLDQEHYLHAAACTMARAARALDQIHAKRVVHRDIKPANILLDRQRPFGVYLCDLGLGRDLEVATAEQMRDGAGTPMYMAPERLLKAPADEILCDVYSLGVTLFETFTLQRPFELPSGIPLPCVGSCLAGMAPRRPRDLRPDLPPRLEAIILKAMARNPQHRHRSAGELASDLEQFQIYWSFRAGRQQSRAIQNGRHRRLTPHSPASAETG